jgi:hypothetical protein
MGSESQGLRKLTGVKTESPFSHDLMDIVILNLFQVDRGLCETWTSIHCTDIYYAMGIN